VSVIGNLTSGEGVKRREREIIPLVLRIASISVLDTRELTGRDILGSLRRLKRGEKKKTGCWGIANCTRPNRKRNVGRGKTALRRESRTQKCPSTKRGLKVGGRSPCSV